MRGKKRSIQKVASRFYDSIAVPALTVGVGVVVFGGYAYQQRQVAAQKEERIAEEKASNQGFELVDPSQRMYEKQPAQQVGQKAAQKAVDKEMVVNVGDCKIEPFVKEVTDQGEAALNQLSQVNAVLVVNANENTQFKNCFLSLEDLRKIYSSIGQEPKSACPNIYDQEQEKTVRYQNLLASFHNRLRAIPDCANIAEAVNGQPRRVAVDSTEKPKVSFKSKKNCESDPELCENGASGAVK